MGSLTAPLGFCPAPRCPNRTSGGPCRDHQHERRKASDKRRGSRQERGYGSAWDRISARWKATHPFCGMRLDNRLHAEHSECARQGIRYAGGPGNVLETDHIVPRERGGADDESNFQTLCRRCHSTKTSTEDGGFGRPGGTDNVFHK